MRNLPRTRPHTSPAQGDARRLRRAPRRRDLHLITDAVVAAYIRDITDIGSAEGPKTNSLWKSSARPRSINA